MPGSEAARLTAAPGGLDAVDRALVEATEAGLPLAERPYHVLADRLGLTPETVMARLRALADGGVIRRTGVVPNHYRLGYVANGMTVWDVDDAVVDTLGAKVGGLDCVSHCYRRPRHGAQWPYNLFAMVHAADRATVTVRAGRIADVLAGHYRAHAVLYSTRILKKTGLRVSS